MATKKLRKGDTVVLKNRMYGVIGSNGRLVVQWLSGTDQVPAIYFTRREARLACEDEGERVIRLADVSGTIV